MPKLSPVHPGEILTEEFLTPLGLTKHQLAIALGGSGVIPVPALECHQRRADADPVRHRASRRNPDRIARRTKGDDESRGGWRRRRTGAAASADGGRAQRARVQ